MKCQVDAIQWGGGSSIIFPWSPKADAIQWGGGSSRIFKAPRAPPLNRPLYDGIVFQDERVFVHQPAIRAKLGLPPPKWMLARTPMVNAYY